MRRETCFGATSRPLAKLLQSVEVVTYLQIAQLSELFPTVIKFAGKWLDLLVDDLVGPHIASLCESLAANVATVRTLASVSSLVGLYKSDVV